MAGPRGHNHIGAVLDDIVAGPNWFALEHERLPANTFMPRDCGLTFPTRSGRIGASWEGVYLPCDRAGLDGESWGEGGYDCERVSCYLRSPPNSPEGGASVMLERLEQQQRLTSNQWKLIITGNLADLLDFFDFFRIGYVLAFITKEWGGFAS